jgi:hypothetical protein
MYKWRVRWSCMAFVSQLLSVFNRVSSITPFTYTRTSGTNDAFDCWHSIDHTGFATDMVHLTDERWRVRCTRPHITSEASKSEDTIWTKSNHSHWTKWSLSNVSSVCNKCRKYQDFITTANRQVWSCSLMVLPRQYPEEVELWKRILDMISASTRTVRTAQTNSFLFYKEPGS